MSDIRGLRRYFRLPWRSRARLDADVDAELGFHLDMRMRELVEMGRSPAAAREEALRQFGDLEDARGYLRSLDAETERSSRRAELVDELRQDVRYALRQLRISPGFASVAVLTLALGIGLSTAIFSVMDAMLLRRLPFPEPDRLVIPVAVRGESDRGSSVSYGDLVDWQGEHDVFQSVAIYTTRGANLGGEGTGEAERVEVASVSQDFFEAVGASPVLGRTFVAEEFTTLAARPVLVSAGLWRRRFAADPAIVGRTIRLNAFPVTVIGVMPEATRWPRQTDVWLALAMDDPAVRDMRRDNRIWQAIARLGPGVPLELARARVAAIATRVREASPETQDGWSATVHPIHDWIVGPETRRALYVLLGAVAFVLLIACVNVAHLLMARSATREREIAVRSALGAGRSRIVRQFLTESLVLALLGGAAGMLLSVGASRGLVAIAPPELPRLDEVRVNGAVLAFATGAALLTVFLFGLLPAVQASRTEMIGALKEGGRRASGGVSSRRTRSTLVIAEVALSLVLLIGAGLMLRSFAKLQGVDPGVRTERLLTIRLALPSASYPHSGARARAYAELVQRVATLPEVRGAALTSALPIGGGGFYLGRAFLVEGKPEPPNGPDHDAMWNVVTPAYFATAGIPLIAGRDFTAQDDSASTPVMIVSRSMARQLFGDETPLGRRVRSWRDENVLREIVGVVGDLRYFGLDESSSPPLVYVPHRQDPWSGMVLMVHTHGSAATAAMPLRRLIAAFDKDLAVGRVQTINEIIAGSVARIRLTVLLLATFGGAALLLAAVGLYGLVSYSVAQRTREIGIRMALGAETSAVRRLVVWQGMVLTGLGVALGVLGALALTRVLSAMLYDVSATDPATYLVLSLALGAVALVASWIPARRATRVDPITALRAE